MPNESRQDPSPRREPRLANPARSPRVTTERADHGIWWMGDPLMFLANREDTGGIYTTWIDNPPPRFAAARHIHTREEEAFFVVEGEATFQVGNQSFVARPGAFLAIPKGIPHGWVSTDRPTKLLTLFAPSGFDGFFFEMGLPTTEPQPDPDTYPEIVRVNTVAGRFGTTFLGPSDTPEWGRMKLAAGRSPVLLNPDEGIAYSEFGVVHVLKAGGDQTDDEHAYFECIFAPNGEIPPHAHAGYEEGLFVREGTVRMNLGQDTHEVGPGGFAVVPKGTVHGVRNATDKPARVLSITLPAGLERFVNESFRPVKGATSPARETDAEGLARIKREATQHGVRFE